ncbi:MAG: hypothetical protein IJU26_01640 [Synergistaceae bacterium]|nr:hypothetical protein [Synergistaceae bacterium]
MQRKFLGALLLCVAVFTASMSWAADMEINEQNFPDPAFRRSYAKTATTAASTHKQRPAMGLSVMQKINAVTTITLDHWSGYRGIENLSGIHYFTELETLDCSNQKLTRLSLLLPALTSLNYS